MPLKFEVKKKLISRSERVKSVELHPDLPWVLAGLFSGNITIYDHQSQSIVRTLEVSSSPVRSAKFIARKQMIVTGSDDLQIRVYNYNTMEKVKQFDAHGDYIRFILVHPTQPYLLTSSDDSTIKIWDMDNNFSLVRSLDDHINYVMMLALNPRDPNTFASASQDRSIKVWTIQSSKANYTLNGHQSGLNCIDYFKGDKPYLISGADDRLIKIWDYQTKQCIHTLEGHQQNISAAVFHPELPLIISTAEDGAIRFWHSQTYKLETTLNYNMERIWSVDISKDSSNLIAFGFDDGTVVVKIGSDEPVVSMNSGKVVFAKNMEFFTINLKAISSEETFKDGGAININSKELGTADLYPIGVAHSPNGYLFAIYSDQEYSIYRSQTFKNAGFGQGTDVVWSPQNDYAVRDTFTIKFFKSANNTLHLEIKTDFIVEQLFGGPLLAARGGDFIIFYDWETAKVIRKIDVTAKKVIWNETNTQVVLATTEDIFFLTFQVQLMEEFQQREEEVEGFEDAFDVGLDLSEAITSGCWVAGVFYFTTQAGKICYTVGGKVNTLDTEKRAFILGYIQQQNRLFLMDKYYNIISYEVNYQVSEFQTLISNDENEKALEILGQINEKHLDKLARFLDSINRRDLAYKVTRNPEHKFDLAIQLGFVDEAFRNAQENKQTLKLRQVGDLALQQGKIKLAIQALEAADDLGGLFLIYSSLNMRDQLEQLGHTALEQTKMNIAFQCFFLVGDAQLCHQVLIQSKRFPEAAIFAKTYLPSAISESVKLWKESLAKSHPVISQKIADPCDYPEQFNLGQ